MEVTESFKLDKNGDKLTLTTEKTQNVDEIIEDNKQRRNSGDNGFTDGKTLRHIAGIPVLALENAIRMGYNLDMSDFDTFQKELYRYLDTFGREAGYQSVDKLVHHGINDGHIIIK